MATCGNCGAENPASHAFCSACGTALARSCPSCETANDPENRFCFNCGTSLSPGPAVERPQSDFAESPVEDPGERRLVSVLFADLVGFTTYSEGRDPEEVRSMLTRFYEKCRDIIDRHGGTTDKFIGDAVMGVWGAGEANEDDAERATRAALELVDMVVGLGGELGIAELAARAGVLSGEASVGSGGNAHGLVVGDLVNTASRLQSVAPPGSVYVGEATRDLVGAAIEFREVGEQTVKGKEKPVAIFEAVRVLALSTSRKRELLEGPFVGRDDELRLLKDQLHATGRESRARMVSIIGEGGIGKSRLAMELIRYIDGIAETIYYHSGRSPSYGDGVTFWALGEMIRQRARISEGEEPGKARMKLRTIVAEFVPDEVDQRWIEPRLAAVIGLASSPPGERAEQFAALRSFFQAIATRGTVLMVFEDVQWADQGLLDFIEELVERTTTHPILVLCLARPELLERRPGWATGRKRTLSVHLGRLDDQSMRALVFGLAPALPETMVERIADRTAGVPLHAVEFVRMLLNTGQLIHEGTELVFRGNDEQMPIPDSVSAIIGSRIDRLDPASQTILRDASVLGLTFTTSSLASLRGQDPEEVEPVLRELTRREILDVEDDVRSPERGQYRFVQSLIREVAYARLSRQERVTRHLQVAEMFHSADDPELAGVVASHYADAVAADPENDELVARACQAVVEAAERAAALKSDSQAAGLYERAAEMTSSVARQNELRLEAARCLARTGRDDRAADLAREVLAWSRDEEEEKWEVRAATTLASILSGNFEPTEAASVTGELFARIPPADDAEWVALAQETSRAMMLSDRHDEAIGVAETAIPVMENLETVEALLETLINKAGALGFQGRLIEAGALLRGVAEIAGERGLMAIRLRALNNLVAGSQYDETLNVRRTGELDELVERLGEEAWLVRGYFFGSFERIETGHLDEALERLSSAEQLDVSEFWADQLEIARILANLYKEGLDEDLLGSMQAIHDKYIDSPDAVLSVAMRSGMARVHMLQEQFEEALSIGLDVEPLRVDYPEAAEVAVLSAAQLGDSESLRQLIALLHERHPRGRASRGLAHLARSYLLALQGDLATAEEAFLDAEALWSGSVPPLRIAYARAVYALVVGEPDEVAMSRAAQAREFFVDHGFQLHLEGIMNRLGGSADSPGLAV